jgi:hypothetical protein
MVGGGTVGSTWVETQPPRRFDLGIQGDLQQHEGAADSSKKGKAVS